MYIVVSGGNHLRIAMIMKDESDQFKAVLATSNKVIIVAIPPGMLRPSVIALVKT